MVTITQNISPSDRDHGASETAHAHPAAADVLLPAADVLPAAAHPVSAQ